MSNHSIEQSMPDTDGFPCLPSAPVRFLLSLSPHSTETSTGKQPPAQKLNDCAIQSGIEQNHIAYLSTYGFNMREAASCRLPTANEPLTVSAKVNQYELMQLSPPVERKTRSERCDTQVVATQPDRSRAAGDVPQSIQMTGLHSAESWSQTPCT